MPTKQAITEALENCLSLGEEEYRKLPRDGRKFKKAISYRIEYGGRRLDMRPIWYDASEACGENDKRQKSDKTVAALRSKGFVVTHEIVAKNDISIQKRPLPTLVIIENQILREIRFWSRNRPMRSKRLIKDKYTCQACDFQSAKIYQNVNDTCLEVHHLKPLNLEKTSKQIVDISDIVTLCANCHRAIHAHMLVVENEVVSIAQFKKIVIR